MHIAIKVLILYAKNKPVVVHGVRSVRRMTFSCSYPRYFHCRFARTDLIFYNTMPRLYGIGGGP
jgi:hypothetical protein